jgi:hypothetical protein
MLAKFKVTSSSQRSSHLTVNTASLHLTSTNLPVLLKKQILFLLKNAKPSWYTNNRSSLKSQFGNKAFLSLACLILPYFL